MVVEPIPTLTEEGKEALDTILGRWASITRQGIKKRIFCIVSLLMNEQGSKEAGKDLVIEAAEIVINKAHRDFVYAGKQKIRKLRYICRLFCKELLLHNYPGLKQDDLLERMIELSIYTEENLK